MKLSIALFTVAYLIGLPAFAKEHAVFNTASPVVIDGKLDEADWGRAEKLELKDLVKGTPCKKESWCKVMSDDEYLYIGAFFAEKEVESLVPKDAAEPRRLAEREREPEYANTIMFNDSYAEVFLDPDGDGKKYMELHINAAGRVNDWWINEVKRRSDGLLDNSPDNFHMEWDCEGLKCEAFVHGTMNDNEDTDKGWSFELAIPYKALKNFFKDGLTKKLSEEKLTTLLVRVDQFGRKQLYYSWPVIGEFNCHKPDKFGELKLR